MALTTVSLSQESASLPHMAQLGSCPCLSEGRWRGSGCRGQLVSKLPPLHPQHFSSVLVHQQFSDIESSFASAMMRPLHLGAPTSGLENLSARRHHYEGMHVAFKRPVTLPRIPRPWTLTPFHPEETEDERTIESCFRSLSDF